MLASASAIASTCKGRASQAVPRWPPHPPTSATITGLRPGRYLAKVVPVNFKKRPGPAAKVTFKIP